MHVTVPKKIAEGGPAVGELHDIARIPIHGCEPNTEGSATTDNTVAARAFSNMTAGLRRPTSSLGSYVQGWCMSSHVAPSEPP